MNTATTDKPQASLLLLPTDPDWRPDRPDTLARALREKGLIHDPLANGKQRYHVGENYLDYIAYLGCAPNLSFHETPDCHRFCHIHLIQLEQPRLFSSTIQAKAPLCANCKQPVDSWRERLLPHAPWLDCPHCHHRARPHEYNWRKTAGFASTGIEITEIHPHEAVPADALMQTLAALSAANGKPTTWHYCYYCR